VANSDETRNFGSRLVRSLLGTAGVLSSIAVITAWMYGADRIFRKDFGWRQTVVATVTGLHAGYSIQYFKSQLGVPVESHSTSRGFKEDVFKGRGYWVEALTKGSSEVMFYSVTVCDPSIDPSFTMPNVGSVTLNHSSLASVTSSAQYYYWLEGLGGTDSPTMKEFDYGGLQGGFRVFMWGLSSACSDSVGQMLRLQQRFANLGPGPVAKKELAEIRRHATANVYGETAPGIQITDLPNNPEELGVNPVSVDLVAPFFGTVTTNGGSMTVCKVPGLPALRKSPSCGR